MAGVITGAILGAIAGAATGYTAGAIVGAIVGGVVGWGLSQWLKIPSPSTISPRYGQEELRNTVDANLTVPVLVGRQKLAGNKVRLSDPGGTREYILALTEGPIEGATNLKINDIWWNRLNGFAGFSKTLYTGTWSQTADGRFTDDPQTYRGVAYWALTLRATQQIQGRPKIMSIVEGLKVTPIAGGAEAFSRNPAVLLWHVLTDIMGYSTGVLDSTTFTSLESYCNARQTGDTSVYSDDLCRGGLAEADSEYHRLRAAEEAFLTEDSGRVRAWVGNTVGSGWLRYDFGGDTKRVVTKYMVQAKRVDLGGRAPSDWTFQGSNNAADWDTLDTQSGITWASYKLEKFFTFANTTAYRYYRLNITDTVSSIRPEVMRMKMYGPPGAQTARYTFDFLFDASEPIEDIVRMLCASFGGALIRSQGKYKPVWRQAGSATVEITRDQIVANTFTYATREGNNVLRVRFCNMAKNWKQDTVELRDEQSIEVYGERVYEDDAMYLLNEESARRRLQRLWAQDKYIGDTCALTTTAHLSGLEPFDIVELTYEPMDWFARAFTVIEVHHRPDGTIGLELEEYIAEVYTDELAPTQGGTPAASGNPFDVYPVQSVSLTEGGGFDPQGVYSANVKIQFSEPDDSAYWDHIEIWVSTDDANFDFYGNAYTTNYYVYGTNAGFDTDDTVYFKLVSVNINGTNEDIEELDSESIALSGGSAPAAPDAAPDLTAMDDALLIDMVASTEEGVTGMRVYVDEDPTNPPVTLEIETSATQTTFYGADATKYWVAYSYVNTFGESSKSTSASETTT